VCETDRVQLSRRRARVNHEQNSSTFATGNVEESHSVTVLYEKRLYC